MGTKIIKNQLKNELNLGRPLGIDFSWILVDFGGQVEPSWHGKSSQDPSKNALKNSEKRKASWRRLGGRILGLQNSWDALVPLLALHAGAVAE